MIQNGNWITYTLNNKSNLYNTKPPLVLWLQCISISIFGSNVFALRLPTFFALIGLIISIIIYAKKRFNLLIGLFGSIIILTTPALIAPHVFLTADLDGILVLLTTLLTLITFHFTHKRQITGIRISILAFVFFLGFLAKSTAVFLWIPSLIFILARNSSLFFILKKKQFILSTLAVIIGIIGYYFSKEHYQPGTIERVFFSEYQRFYENIMPWHEHGPLFYLQRIYEKLNPYYLWISFILLPFYFTLHKTRFKHIVFTFFGSHSNLSCDCINSLFKIRLVYRTDISIVGNYS